MNTLVEFLETTVRTFGPSPALMIKPSFRYHVWTYDDMWEATGRVAAYLQASGVHKGDRVIL